MLSKSLCVPPALPQPCSAVLSLQYLTGRLIVLQRDDIAGALLQALQEVDDQVADVLRVGAGEGELLAADSGQGERLLLGLVGPEEGRTPMVTMSHPTSSGL